jgi:hypothetical protein
MTFAGTERDAQMVRLESYRIEFSGTTGGRSASAISAGEKQSSSADGTWAAV